MTTAPALPGSTDFPWTDLDRRAVATVRALAMDAVQKAGNGHPGTAMSLAPAAYLLFQRFLRQDPADPAWLGRDRFVLSCGHSSLTLYIQLFLSGYGLTLDDLKAFRTWGSLTPGHPEHGHTVGVETTTGPLGQGVATAVGMAMASRYQRGLLDPDAPWGFSPFDHRVWVIASDGDLEEGVSGEASSLAGLQRLGNLCVIWDDNHISIEGNTAVAFSEDVVARYASYGWHVHHVGMAPDGDVDILALAQALEEARLRQDRPTFIAMRSVIAWPAPHLRNTGKAHGSALGAEEVAATKSALGLDPAEDFAVAADVLAHARGVGERGADIHAEWDRSYDAWRAAHPERAQLLDRLLARQLPPDLAAAVPVFEAGTSIATRAASGKVINAIAGVMPEFWGGSADLAESNNTTIEGGLSFLPAGTPVPDASPYGRVLHFGIREHAMGAILNGIALEGLTRPFGGTFLVFSDYMRGSVRLAALMQTSVVYVWTHDSVGLGEDGPTHQPIETLWALRALPGLAVVRPCDGNETAQAWLEALRRGTPTGLVLSRQGLPVLDRSQVAPADDVARGAYVLVDGSGAEPRVILIATGSEVSVALAARDLLERDGVSTRVVSAPCLEWFDDQDQAYRDSVLLPSVPVRVSVEAGATFGWWRLVGSGGGAVGIDHFGASADGALLFEKFGITPQAVADTARACLDRA
ncbi:MAG: transketolase [Candidatus Nanopelagicales bacterium]